MKYFTYILECSDRTYYTGITNDLKNRVLSHNSLKSGAKYTRARRPVKLVYHESFFSKNDAMRREFEIKRLHRRQKIELIKSETLPKMQNKC